VSLLRTQTARWNELLQEKLGSLKELPDGLVEAIDRTGCHKNLVVALFKELGKLPPDFGEVGSALDLDSTFPLSVVRDVNGEISLLVATGYRLTFRRSEKKPKDANDWTAGWFEQATTKWWNAYKPTTEEDICLVEGQMAEHPHYMTYFDEKE